MYSMKGVHVLLCVGWILHVQAYHKEKEFRLRNVFRQFMTRANCPQFAPCLSQWGYCGSGPDYCGNGCKAGPCTGGGGSGGGNSGGTFQGDATHYSVSVGYTACGTTHGDNELIAALNAPQFNPHTPNGNPNRNTLCNRQARVVGPRGSVNVRIVDLCPGCKSGDLDLSEAAFRAAIGNLGIGCARITWSWM